MNLLYDVARAIWEANPATRLKTGEPVPFEDAAPPYLDDCYREARAALKTVLNGLRSPLAVQAASKAIDYVYDELAPDYDVDATDAYKHGLNAAEEAIIL